MYRYILIGFAIYFAYRFIFNLVIPLYRTTKQVKKQFDSVRQEQANAQGFGQTPPKQEEGVKKPKVDKDDYIEFEEL
jgi:hypothetical protein